jgi:non-ribosomal peptide synthase protein (TIGR01720 family)
MLATLDPEETEALLTSGVQACRAQVQELLLAGLLLAFHDLTGQDRLRVDVEGHGRESEILGAVDLGETVGWFTTIYPVYLELPDTDGDDEELLVETIKCAKEQLRAVPRRGLDYGLLRWEAGDRQIEALEQSPETAVLFNYLGQIDPPVGEAARFTPLRGDTGPDVDAAHPRGHLLEFNGAVSGGCLQFVLDFDPGQLAFRAVERLADRYVQALRRIIRHSQAPRATAFTPSDFPLAFRMLERT